MDHTEEGISGAAIQSGRAVDNLVNLIDTLNEPTLLIDKELRAIAANLQFYKTFDLSREEVVDTHLPKFNRSGWEEAELQIQLNLSLSGKKNFRDLQFSINIPGREIESFSINGAYLEYGNREFLMLSFKNSVKEIHTPTTLDFKSFENILENAPAMICIVRGPDFVFELANDHYYDLVGKRDLIGKPVKEAIPEAEEQGFLKLLEEVKRSGKAFKGTEVEIKLRINENEEKNSFFRFCLSTAI